jgi:hypothetical protein
VGQPRLLNVESRGKYPGGSLETRNALSAIHTSPRSLFLLPSFCHAILSQTSNQATNLQHGLLPQTKLGPFLFGIWCTLGLMLTHLTAQHASLQVGRLPHLPLDNSSSLLLLLLPLLSPSPSSFFPLLPPALARLHSYEMANSSTINFRPHFLNKPLNLLLFILLFLLLSLLYNDNSARNGRKKCTFVRMTNVIRCIIFIIKRIFICKNYPLLLFFFFCFVFLFCFVLFFVVFCLFVFLKNKQTKTYPKKICFLPPKLQKLSTYINVVNVSI